MIVLYVCFNNRTLSIRIECVFYLDWDVFYTDRVYRWRIDNLCTKVTKLHGLRIRKFINGICTLDDARVSCHKAVNICPYLQDFSVEGCGKDGCRVITSTTPKIGNIARVTVLCYKTRYKRDTRKIRESTYYKFVS